MALGDRVVLLVDEGGREPKEREVVAGSAGGSVGWHSGGGFVTAYERSRSGATRRELVVAAGRLVSLRVEPRS